MTLQSHPCTAVTPSLTQTQRGRRWLLRFAVALVIAIGLALVESWLIEQAPELSIAVDSAANSDSHVTAIRQLVGAAIPVAVLH